MTANDSTITIDVESQHTVLIGDMSEFNILNMETIEQKIETTCVPSTSAIDSSLP